MRDYWNATGHEERFPGFRVLRWLARVAIAGGVIVGVLSWLLPGFWVDGPLPALLAAASIALVLGVFWPLAFVLAGRLPAIFFPFAIFLLSGGLVLLALAVSDRLTGSGVHIESLGTAIWLIVGLSLGMTLAAALFSLDDDFAYDLLVTRSLRDTYAGAPRSETPGVFFLEIDGLAEPVLRQALAVGAMPNLQRWLDSGTHTITGWEPDLSSQTSASQAGILLGDNTGIPAFRWWDKPRGELMVSSHRATARALEAQLSTGDGLLIHDGGSRWNAFSGDAPDCLGTYSTLGDRSRERSNAYLAYFANPFTLVRALLLTVIDVGRERWEAWRQTRENVLPRIKRTWKYAVIRAGTTTLMLEASRFVLAADLLRGVPVTYTTFFGYDEVAHHSGIDRPDVFGVLRSLDRVFGYLARIAADAPRPYHLVVLSDHGQSMGATFRERFGVTLGEVVARLMQPGARIFSLPDDPEALGRLAAAAEQAVQGESRAAVLVREALNRRMAGEAAVDAGQTVADQSNASAGSDAIVLASGNLGIVSFPRWPERLTYEQMLAEWPDLLPGLIAHPGISFVVVQSGKRGPLALGKGGIHFLESGQIDGPDPLAAFGPNAARHLRRESGFANCPDILVISMYDPDTGEVAAFEELVGSHGGLGGSQTEPFVLHPVAFSMGETPVVGAAALHNILKSWIAGDSTVRQAREAAADGVGMGGGDGKHARTAVRGHD